MVPPHWRPATSERSLNRTMRSPLWITNPDEDTHSQTEDCEPGVLTQPTGDRDVVELPESASSINSNSEGCTSANSDAVVEAGLTPSIDETANAIPRSASNSISGTDETDSGRQADSVSTAVAVHAADGLTMWHVAAEHCPETDIELGRPMIELERAREVIIAQDQTLDGQRRQIVELNARLSEQNECLDRCAGELDAERTRRKGAEDKREIVIESLQSALDRYNVLVASCNGYIDELERMEDEIEDLTARLQSAGAQEAQLQAMLRQAEDGKVEAEMREERAVGRAEECAELAECERRRREAGRTDQATDMLDQPPPSQYVDAGSQTVTEDRHNSPTVRYVAAYGVAEFEGLRRLAGSILAEVDGQAMAFSLICAAYRAARQAMNMLLG
ncbi:hypothetical protein LTR85_002428 [Meristemomyces frigidus]|nr:hypothetical protein LTR85_002428 [Meristemomyces frigidus]